MNEPNDPFLTPNGFKRLTVKPQDAADILGVCRGTIWNMIREGALTKIKVGRNVVLIPVSELEAIRDRRGAAE